MQQTHLYDQAVQRPDQAVQRLDQAVQRPDQAVQPTGSRVPREVRIPQVARVAEDLFGGFGYQGTSMEDVARMSGVSKPVVYDRLGSFAVTNTAVAAGSRR